MKIKWCYTMLNTVQVLEWGTPGVNELSAEGNSFQKKGREEGVGGKTGLIFFFREKILSRKIPKLGHVELNAVEIANVAGAGRR
jgi:hypothetical protein